LLSRLKIEGDQPKIEQRIIYMDGKVYPQNGVPNYIKNQKYSLLSFVPSVLFEQFRYFFNLFFLIVTLSQFIPILKVGFLFTYVAPLLFVTFRSIIRYSASPC
jgi:phospholipid-translocating ATPase